MSKKEFNTEKLANDYDDRSPEIPRFKLHEGF